MVILTFLLLLEQAVVVVLAVLAPKVLTPEVDLVETESDFQQYSMIHPVAPGPGTGPDIGGGLGSPGPAGGYYVAGGGGGSSYYF